MANSQLETRDVVVEFMKTYLQQRGHPWEQQEEPGDDHKTAKQKKKLNDLCQILNEISNKLHEHTRLTRGHEFKELISLKELLDNFHYDAFKELADELFSGEIKWSRIVVLLAHSTEWACRIIETKQDNNHNTNHEADEMVSQIVNWICTYIDENLLQWINDQDGDWMSAQLFLKQLSNEGNMRHYYGLVAFAVSIGLYLCSKISFQ